ncbi:MAG TPA: DUF4097 family beta strand repeat-containing protein, partial [Candidatus Sulfopaludibacter sp.]|nr:DUF4097 family beta strand repeat-containing protein [Candidatus Sulfopaludibacter sp.]
REQQRAAWRAQRDAWKAQRHQWKGAYGYGVPRVPSVVGPIILIGVGIVALMIATGHIDSGEFWSWYGRWWPLMLIAAGVAMLGEWALDMRRQTPVRRGGNFVGILIVLALIGVFAAWGHEWWGPMRAEWGNNGDEFFNMFGRPQHDMDQQVLNTQIPAGGTIEIQNPRGDVSITAGDSATMQVQAHAVAYADSDQEANKIFASEAAHVTVSGNNVLVKSEGNSSGRLNLTVAIPKTAHVTVNAGRGDVTAANLGAGANVTAAHGDIHLNSITGSVQVHFSTDKGDFSAHQVEGDITADGRCNDLTLSEIHGKVLLNGDIFGEAHMENLAGPVHLHTSVTDLEMASLPGDMTLNDEDLRVTEAKGNVRITTHSKNVDLSQIYGDTFVQDRDGNIAIELAGTYNVDAKSTSGKGDIELSLPPTASAAINAFTHNGDILSDYPVTLPDGESKKVSFNVGSGGAKINLSTDVGDVNIKKGSSFPPAPSISSTPPKPPAPPSAPHLKAPKNPAEPVTQ